VNASHLTIEELKQKLKDYDIDTTGVNNRVILAGILQNRLDKETLEQNKDRHFLLINCNYYIYSKLTFLNQDTSNTETASTNSDLK
ncbi:3219_t:CDS:1, partial [Funneliformis geosporum]